MEGVPPGQSVHRIVEALGSRILVVDQQGARVNVNPDLLPYDGVGINNHHHLTVHRRQGSRLFGRS